MKPIIAPKKIYIIGCFLYFLIRINSIKKTIKDFIFKYPSERNESFIKAIQGIKIRDITAGLIP